jgi:hypothetical protein
MGYKLLFVVELTSGSKRKPISYIDAIIIIVLPKKTPKYGIIKSV